MTYKVGATGGTTVTGAAIIPSRRRLAIVCDDVGLPNGSSQWVGVNANPLASYSANSWWVWALGQMEWPYDLVAISAAAGRTTAQAASNFATEVTPFTPEEVWICIGRNDMTNSASATSALSSLDTIIASCLAINPTMIVRVSTVIPGDATSHTASYQQANAVFNTGVMNRQTSNANVQAIDMGAVLRDPTTAASAGVSGAIDGTGHIVPNQQYSVYMGNYWANQINNAPSVNLRPIGNMDVYNVGVNSASRRFIVNPTYQGSGGTAAAGVTGTIPASWATALISGTGVTMVSSITQDAVPANPYPKSWLNFTMGGTSTGQTVFFISPTLNNMFPPLVAATSTIRTRCSFKTSSLTGVAALYMNLQAFNSGFTVTTINTNMANATGSAFTYPSTFTLELPTFLVPTATANLGPQIILIVQAGISPTGSFSIANFLCEQVA